MGNSSVTSLQYGKKTIEDKSITDPSERERLFGQRDHVRKFGKDYAERLRKSGLQLEENTFVKELSPEKVARFALAPDEVIFVCKKKGISLLHLF